MSNTIGLTTSPEVAVSGDTIHTVCQDDTTGLGTYQVFYRHSLDGGYTFSRGIQLDEDFVQMTRSPSIAVNRSAVHVVYNKHYSGWDRRIAYKRSLDAGISWDEAVILANDCISPEVACEGDTVYVLYTNPNSPRHSCFKRSLNNGIDWSDEIIIEPDNVYADLAACDGIVYSVYRFYESDHCEIFLRRGLSGGEYWEEPVQVSGSEGVSSQHPHISVQNGGRVGVSWMDYENSPMSFSGYIHCRVSDNYGEAWNDIQVISSTYYCTSNDLSICNEAIHVAYADQREGLLHMNIYYRQSPDGGTSWLPEEQICTNTDMSQYPSIAAAPKQVSLVWEEYSTVGDGVDIFYRAGDISCAFAPGGSTPKPAGFQLLPPYPNPTNSVVQIPFISERHNQNITIRIINVAGQTIQQWRLGSLQPGEHAIRWDANSSGMPVVSGCYYVLINSGLKQYTQSIVIIK